MNITDSEYVFDLSRMLIELDDEALTTKNLTACIFAASAKSGMSPGQYLVEISESMPSYEEWFEEVLPTLIDVPDDYESIGDE